MPILNAHKLQEAIFALLQQNETLSLKLAGIYDEPVRDAVYPYVSMGRTTIASRDVKDLSGDMVSFDLLTWSNQPTQMEVKELMADVDDAVRSNLPAVIGSDIIHLNRTGASIDRQFTSLGTLYRGRLSYNVLMYAKH